MGAAEQRGTLDLWADVGRDHLPPALVRAFMAQDWAATRDELRKVMDGVITDGEYGRELLNLALRLPIGVDPLFDRYRAMVSIDFGDWDGVQACLDRGHPNDPAEVIGLREVILAPLGHCGIPAAATERKHVLLCTVPEAELAQDIRGFRRWADEIQHFRPVAEWGRGDMPIKRHVRYRQLHDALMMAVAHSQGGLLPVALSHALDAQTVGNETEPFLAVVRDIEHLVAAAMGDAAPMAVETFDMVRRSTGTSPLGTWQACWYLFPMLLSSRMADLDVAATLAEHVASGLASPRAHVIGWAWRVASRYVLTGERGARDLPALLEQAQRGSPGLRVIPRLLGAIASQRPDDFLRAASLARRTGHVWAQISALVWATALDPSPHVARRLTQLLTATGWRRPALVPPGTTAEAALGLTSVGIRARSIVELAAVTGRPNVIAEVARRHLEDPAVTLAEKTYALEALAGVDTSHAQELLRRTAERPDDVGRHAASLVARPSHPHGLSDREIEVLGLAGRGMTNRQIADALSLSVHTVARHLANSRSKIGAANRVEAAARLADWGR